MLPAAHDVSPQMAPVSPKRWFVEQSSRSPASSIGPHRAPMAIVPWMVQLHFPSDAMSSLGLSHAPVLDGRPGGDETAMQSEVSQHAPSAGIGRGTQQGAKSSQRCSTST